VLNLLCDVVMSLASEPGDAAAAAALDAAVAADVLPLAPALLEEDEPMPLYALGLMAGGPPWWAAPLARLGAAGHFYEWLSVDHPCNNVHNIRLCGRLAAAGALNAEELRQLDAVERAAAVLEYAAANGVVPFLAPSLGLYAVLAQSVVGVGPGLHHTLVLP
jgi:serine/threonine-protein kinase ULK4